MSGLTAELRTLDSMRVSSPLGTLFLLMLIAGSCSPALATGPAGQEPRIRVVEPEQLKPGDRITVYQNSGRALEMIVDEVDATPRCALPADLTGSYVSEINDKDKKFFQKESQKKLVFTLERHGETITGRTSSLPGGIIEGVCEGDTISFYFYAVTISGYQLTGEWKIRDGGNLLEGKWQHPVQFSAGKWNLARLDPLEAARPLDPPVIKGRLAADQSAIELKLADIDRIERANPDLDETTTPGARLVAAPRQDCTPGTEAGKAIEDARSAWNRAEYTPGMYDLIMQAEAAASPPECDDQEAIELAGQAMAMAKTNTQSSPVVTAKEIPQTEANETIQPDGNAKEYTQTKVSEQSRAAEKSTFRLSDGGWEFGVGLVLVDQPFNDVPEAEHAYGGGVEWIIGKEFLESKNWLIGGQLQVLNSSSDEMVYDGDVNLEATNFFVTARPKVFPYVEFKAGISQARYENVFGDHSTSGLVYGAALTQGEGRLTIHFLDFQVYDLGSDKIKSTSLSFAIFLAFI